MAAFANGKFTIANCDRCGFQYKLTELKEITVRRKKTGLMVCPECWEPDHPQNMQGMYKVVDPQAVHNPRPDTSRAQSVGVAGWNPVFVYNSPIVLGEVNVA